MSLEYSMSVKLLIEHYLEILSLKGGCKGSSEYTLIKMPNCWKLHGLDDRAALIRANTEKRGVFLVIRHI